MMIKPSIRILVINPNTSEHMTDGLKPAIANLAYQDVDFSFFTSPTPGIPSINSPDDAAKSASVCLPHIIPLLQNYDAFLVACYSEHPLVPQIQSELNKLLKDSPQEGKRSPKYVIGIFEASVSTSLSLVGSTQNTGFGIVSTGKVWEQALQSATEGFVGSKQLSRFLGCETTGLNASELHELPAEIVNKKMMEATKKLLVNGKRAGVDVQAICLGCAGMVGLDEAVRQACIEELGNEVASLVRIVDGVKAGVGILVSLAKCGF